MQVHRTLTAPRIPASLAPRDLVQQLMALPDQDEHATRTLLARHAGDLGRQDEDGNAPLHLAVRLGNSSRIVAALIKAGAQPTTNMRGQTPLHIAASRPDGNPAIVSELLSAGGLPLADRPDREGRTALDLARRHGPVEVVDRLISDIHVLERCASWRQDAVGTAWSRLVRKLEDPAPLYAIQQAVDDIGGVNAIDPRGMSLLMRAADAGRSDVVGWLLEHGANPNMVLRSPRTGIGCSALMLGLPYPAVTRLLLAWGANPMEPYCAAAHWWSRPQTVLHVAALSGAPDSMSALLQERPRQSWNPADLGAALLTALRESRSQVAFALLEYTGALDTRTMREALPLAVTTGDHELVHLMLTVGRDAYRSSDILPGASKIAAKRDDTVMLALLVEEESSRSANRRKDDGSPCLVQ